MKEIIAPIILGIVQGVTEFLPISSDGHLAIVHHLLGYRQGDLFFDVILHLATLLVVLQLLGREFFTLLKRAYHNQGEEGAEARKLVELGLIGTLPAVVFGFLAKSEIETMGNRATLVAVFIFVNGLMLLIPRFLPVISDWDLRRFTKVRALFVGIAQAAAILPGISRSGSTITTAQLLKLNPQSAFKFSFFLFIPAVTGAVVLNLFDLIKVPKVFDWQALTLAFGAAFLSGFFALKILLRVLERGGFYRFGYYCLAFGALSFIYFAMK